ncbi:interaptin isoform X1 [Bombus huntii]|uniref:interaptin isoform X1 n=1 Tax=Bombus huntii TaxID=85661 RepID=UPI0021AA298D|nr:interaptin isoform X1 [Bombus huntii]XP_050475728.1 interaptin isoform X1 [Bombus huntii]
MEQLDEVHSNINKVESSIKVDVSSSLILESTTDIVKDVKDIPENQENKSQECADNIIQDVLVVNKCDITDLNKKFESKESSETESIKNAAINEVEQEIIDKDPQIDDQCKEDEKSQEEQAENTTEVGDHSRYADDTSLDKESTNNVEVFNTNEGEQNIEKHNVCTVLNIDTVGDTNAQCQALIKTLSETFDDKDQTLHVTDTDTDLSKLVDSSSEVMVLTVETINEMNESTEENIVLTVHEKDAVNSNEKNVSAEQKEMKNTEIVNEEFNLIDYAQESDGTIIEVISTEIVAQEVPENCSQKDNKEVLNHTKTGNDSITPITSGVINDLGTAGDIDIKEKNVSIKEGTDIKGEDIKEECKNTDAKYNVEQETTNGNGKTESFDSSHKINVEKKIIHNKIVVPTHVANTEGRNKSISEADKVSITNKRSVIQDIFDDWGVENAEDDSQSVSKTPDTVEIELKSLLNDTKTRTIEEGTVVLVEEEITCIEKEPVVDDGKAVEVAKQNKEMQVSKEQLDNNQTIKKQQNSIKSLLKDQLTHSISQAVGKSTKDSTHDTVTFSQTSQIIPINRGRNLTSQSSQVEIAEALKERFREKQKVVEQPPRPDIFFVKKLTQRLSSKLVGSPGTALPALIPLPQPTNQSLIQCDKKSSDNTSTGTSKESNSDNKELLAILEGDVDPDWSNLKPPILAEEGKRSVKIEQSGYNTPPKLDPLVERELALKQLLELPLASSTRSIQKKKKIIKATPTKSSKAIKTKIISKTEKETIGMEPKNKTTESVEDTNSSDYASSSLLIESHTSERKTDIRVDESRSGRKRKLTEKAREHEQQQNIVKRQKVYKGKLSLGKKQPQDQAPPDISLLTENHVSKETMVLPNDEVDVIITDEITEEHVTNNNKVDITLDKLDDTQNVCNIKPSKQNLNKKRSQSIAKQNIAVKKILRQNISSNKKTATLKTKLNTSKKSGSKIVSKAKRSTENNAGDSKPKKKIINEIDRLLQDEGVVNLLYDVEQPDKKRLVPITKSQAKVMDIQKVQRELKLRKKLVRNAVLRLRTSAGVSKPRSKRTSIYLNDMQVDKKIGDQATPIKQINLSQEFILPAKIRNAADASVIIRRHSSSSFSSASGSPRVSIDTPEKNEGVKVDEGGFHSLRSTKRRHSQDEKINVKKSKKKIVQKSDTGIDFVDIVEDKMVFPERLNKKLDSKKADKNPKQPETDETNNGLGKVITRSNGTATGKVTSKTKKTTKNKVTFAKTNEPDNNEEFSKEEDELSACLAEAANALSVVNAGSRSANSATNRKNKVNANTTKTLESDNNKTKMEIRSQFSNKEINIRRHGNLVQLILTPSSSTKIRNALTLQVMQEFRETLSILKKDDDCRVVLLTSTGSSFCEGLELSMLLHTNKEKRRIHAQEMADAVKEFIKSLASFNKPIVAGVQGAAVGLGVTMLPLFDLVIASDKATFSTPYGKLGQIAEGAAVFTLSHILGSAITSELLLGGRTLTASEALRAGLVTRVLWPDRFQVELLPTLKAMSEQSSQSMEATKTLLRHSLRKKLDAALESETYLLIQHWCSVECQTAIKAYIDGKVQ